MQESTPVKPVRKVAVIGAGVMGSGIAAQAANAGAQVLLLDIPPRGVAADAPAAERNAVAAGAVERMLRAGSGGALMEPAVAERIRVGNTEDDLAALGDADWIVEAVVERLDIKQALYRRIAEVRSADAIVSSNTSTIPLQALMEGMPLSLKEHFVVTHFFNPPRQMRLVELVTAPETRPDVAARMEGFLDPGMGKRVIRCNDRPGFIANRLGVYWMQVALQEAIALELSVEEADAIMRVCGFPGTGVFGLWDLVGLDLMPEVTASLSRLLEEDDPFQRYATTVPVLEQMLERGWHGRKGRVLQGFYRRDTDAKGQRRNQVLDLATLEYRDPLAVELESVKLGQGEVSALINADDAGGRYAWRVLSRVLDYATRLVPDVAEQISEVDVAMRLGYNWRFGPFELLDRIGMGAFADRLKAEGGPVSDFILRAGDQSCYLPGKQLDWQGRYQPVEPAQGIMDWGEISARPALEHFEFSRLHELAEDAWCLEFTSRINTLNPTLLNELEAALHRAEAADKGLILYSRSGVFAAGADLKAFVEMAAEPGAVGAYIRRGQQLFARLRQSSVPVVAAVTGKALGGGLELLFHCHGVQAHAEVQLGLVETRAGIVPGWGGCRELLARSCERLGPDRAICHAFDLIRHGRVCGSALEARRWGLLRDRDGISMNPDRLLSDALELSRKVRQERMSPQKWPPLAPCEPAEPLALEGYQGVLEQRLLQLVNCASEPEWFDRFADLERECNLALLQYPESIERMRALLETGRPLRN